jgi:hypothetical protein
VLSCSSEIVKIWSFRFFQRAKTVDMAHLMIPVVQVLGSRRADFLVGGWRDCHFMYVAKSPCQ